MSAPAPRCVRLTKSSSVALPYFHSTAPRCQDNRQFFCHFNWLVRHTPHTYTSPSLSPSPRHPPATVDTTGPGGQGVTYCRTRVIPLDDETYFTGTDASNDADGDGRADRDHDHTDASTETPKGAAGEPKGRGLLKPWWDWLTGLGRPSAAERRRINMDWDGCLHKPPPQTATAAAAAAAAAAVASHASVDRQPE